MGSSRSSLANGAAARVRLIVVAGLAAVATAAVASHSSSAAAGQLDPTFGQNGLTVVAGADRYEAQGAPLVGADGRIVIAGLLKNASDRVFLNGLTAAGANDNTFGTAGTVQTSTKATERRAVTARRADGRLVVGGRSDSGRLQLESFNTDGSRDTAFGSNGTLTATVPNNNSVPTAMVVSGNSTWVALTNSTASQRKGFVVAKLTQTGLDTTFGSGGVATISFGNSAGQAFDLALDAAGKLVVTGSIGTLGANASQTRVVRLNANGALDTSFSGDGAVDFDASQASRADHGVALLPAADGTYVVSSADGKTAVAKLDGAGALAPAYAGDGIAQGLAPSGAGFAPADAIRDSHGSIVVAGESLAGSTTKWALLRVNPSGAAPLDNSFGQGGYIVIDECQNTAGNGPSGLTEPLQDTLLVAGGCGAANSVAVARLVVPKRKTTATATALEISPSGGAAGHERIPLDELDPSAVLGAGEALQATATRHTATRHTATRHTATRHTATRHTGLFSIATRHTATRHTLLSQLPLVGTTWQALLGVDVPLQTLTLEDALEINPEAVGNLTLADIDPNATALRETTLASLLLGLQPLNSVPAPDGGWCAFISSMPANCGNGVDPAVWSLFDLEVSGDNLSEYYGDPISLVAADLGAGDDAAPVTFFPLAELDMGVKPFRDAKASEFASILACGTCAGTLADLSPAQLGSATVGQLVALLPKPSMADLSVGEVLVALLPAADIPYEQTEAARLLDEAEFRSAGVRSYRQSVEADCGDGTLRSVVDLGDDARVVPGSSTLAIAGGGASQIADPTRENLGDPYVFDLAGLCSGRTGQTQGELRFTVEPGSVLGLGQSTARLEGETASFDATDDTATDDSHDPGDTIEASVPLGEDALRTGHISSDTDIDTYTFSGVPGEMTITLSHLPADYDLVILGPALGPEATATRHTATRHTATRHTPLPDSSDAPTDPAVLPPDTVEDIATRHTATRHTATRHTSINRGTSDESSTVTVRPSEAGETFYAMVIGYNGASDEDAYVIRRADRPSDPPLECLTRTLTSAYSPVAFPSSIPATTQSLYLVHPGRLAARYGQTAASETMARLADVAAATQGVVVPLDANPAVSAAFAAADANPCSPDRANDVVTAINGVVDGVRQSGNGLKELRSIVLVGSDEIIPQGRVPDGAVLANEADYADDAATNQDLDAELEDNAVSGSLREGFVLSDDPYGDFDPGLEPQLWVPDVALGRLVETPQQISRQLQDFTETGGVVRPQRAFVTGYDFIADGSSDTFSSLSSLVPNGSAVSRIDETWTGDDAENGLEAAGAGVFAPNAHYDHFRLLPAAAFNAGTPDLLYARDVNTAPGSLSFSLGCHGGLNLAVGSIGGAADPRLADWVEQMAANRTLYAGNTGYGYGDTEVIAYSERLMADYARLLASGDVSSGQALMIAKQTNAATFGVTDAYWNKASMEATFYGLPMYEVGDSGASAPSAMPDQGGSTATGPETRSSTPIDLELSDELERVDGDRGTHWEIEGEEPLVVQHRTVEPKKVVDVTNVAGPAVSFLIEELVTSDIHGINPVIARPTIDLEDHEPEPVADDPFFPARMATVDTAATPEGRRDLLTLIAGSTRDDTQRLILGVGGQIQRSTAIGGEPAVIRRVDGTVSGNNFSVRVEVEGERIMGGNMLYVTDAQVAGGGPLVWNKVNLSTIAPGILGAGGTLASGSEIAESFIQVTNEWNQVSLANRKVEGHAFTTPPDTDPGAPQVVLDPAPPSSGYYGSPPQVNLDPVEHDDARFEVSVDGDAFQTFEGPFTVPGDGEHQVFFRGSDGSTATSRWAVDSGPPTITATSSHTAGEQNWYGEPVTVSFVCADAGSGVASCPAPVTLSSQGQNQSVTRSATDKAGNSASTTFGPINIDLTKPTTSAKAMTSPNSSGWYRTPVTVRYTCADALSGIAVCGGQSVTGAPLSTTKDVQVAQEGAAVTASAPASDRAGNTATASVSPAMKIDMTNPTVRITTPDGTLLLGALGQRLQGTAFDGASRIASVTVTYKRTNGTNPQTKTATLNCNATTGNCTWTAALPSGLGAWRATATATDKAGNTFTDPSSIGFNLG